MDAVNPWAVQAVRNSDTASDGHEVNIEVLVYQVELLGRGKRTRSAVDFAWEFTVSGIVFIFPHLKKIGCNSSVKGIAVRRRNSVHTMVNCGSRYGGTDDPSSAPLSMKTTRRLPESNISLSVGQSSRIIGS
jgi:hypothetical protein